MTIICVISYEIDPYQRDEFKKYAENWGRIIPRCGGHLVGYFLPYEGTNNVAWGLIAFDSLASRTSPERWSATSNAGPRECASSTASNGNSVKLYDKAYTPNGSVLRAEATFHNGDDFRVYRRKEGDRKGPSAWRRLRRGIADLHRRAQLSHKAAARYLDAFATVDDTTTLDQLLQRLQRPRQWRGRRVRALRPIADDRALLSAINHGEFAIHGFRNRDLRAIFFPRLPTTNNKPAAATLPRLAANFAC